MKMLKLHSKLDNLVACTVKFNLIVLQFTSFHWFTYFFFIVVLYQYT